MDSKTAVTVVMAVLVRSELITYETACDYLEDLDVKYLGKKVPMDIDKILEALR